MNVNGTKLLAAVLQAAGASTRASPAQAPASATARPLEDFRQHRAPAEKRVERARTKALGRRQAIKAKKGERRALKALAEQAWRGESAE